MKPKQVWIGFGILIVSLIGTFIIEGFNSFLCCLIISSVILAVIGIVVGIIELVKLVRKE